MARTVVRDRIGLLCQVVRLWPDREQGDEGKQQSHVRGPFRVFVPRVSGTPFKAPASATS